MRNFGSGTGFGGPFPLLTPPPNPGPTPGLVMLGAGWRGSVVVVELVYVMGWAVVGDVAGKEGGGSGFVIFHV